MGQISTKTVAVRRLQFCSGHRVYQHEGKCATPHGHNYIGYFHAEAPGLDSVGRVIDFSVIKDKLGTWIDTHWDHKFLVFFLDTELTFDLKKGFYIMPCNPTAENMAMYLLKEIAPPLFKETGVTITKIVLYETENCFVEVTL